jgi:hypothetical protein
MSYITGSFVQRNPNPVQLPMLRGITDDTTTADLFDADDVDDCVAEKKVSTDLVFGKKILTSLEIKVGSRQ